METNYPTFQAYTNQWPTATYAVISDKHFVKEPGYSL